MTTYLLVVTCFLLGCFLKRYAWANAKLTPALNNFAIYVALPAIIFAKAPDLKFSANALFPVSIAWLGMGISVATFWFVGRRYAWRRDYIIATIVLTGLGNTAFLGMAASKLLLSERGLPFAIIYDQLGSFLVLSLACPLALSFSDSNNPFPSAMTIIKRVVLFPPFASLIIALFLPISWLTNSLQTPLEWLGMTLLPLAMLIVGMQFYLNIEKTHRAPAALAIMIKMVLLPLLASLIGLTLAIPTDIFSATILQSAMPAMVTPALFLISAGIAPRLSSTILSIGTLLCFITLPIVALLLN